MVQIRKNAYGKRSLMIKSIQKGFRKWRSRKFAFFRILIKAILSDKPKHITTYRISLFGFSGQFIRVENVYLGVEDNLAKRRRDFAPTR